MKRLLQIGADQPDHVRARMDQALRNPVDAITQVFGGMKDALAGLARYARPGSEGTRDGRT
ncbi:MAG: hypothetical protein ABIQ29_04615 [Burkholderiaceae bacterium]